MTERRMRDDSMDVQDGIGAVLWTLGAIALVGFAFVAVVIWMAPR